MRIGILPVVAAGNEAREAGGRFVDALAEWLRGRQHDVILPEDPPASGIRVMDEAERFARADCDGVLLPVSPGPVIDQVVQAALLVNCPVLLVGDDLPAVVDAAGALTEVGIPFDRVLSSGGEDATRARIADWLDQHKPDTRRRGEEAAQRLHGARYGAFGRDRFGLDASQWLSQFGVHVQHISLSALQEQAQQVAPGRIAAGMSWLEHRCAAIDYDGQVLTPGHDGTLARQLRWYLALRDRCGDERIAFCSLPSALVGGDGAGCAGDLPIALLNDREDWEGPRLVTICAPDSDANGALTMQLLHGVSGQPVLAAELLRLADGPRHLDLRRTAATPPFFARHADDFVANLGMVAVKPAPAGGALLGFPLAAVSVITFARITRRLGRFRCLLACGELAESAADESISALLPGPVERLVGSSFSRYLHATVGDHRGAMKAACEALDIEPVLLGGGQTLG